MCELLCKFANYGSEMRVVDTDTILLHLLLCSVNLQPSPRSSSDASKSTIAPMSRTYHHLLLFSLAFAVLSCDGGKETAECFEWSCSRSNRAASRCSLQSGPKGKMEPLAGSLRGEPVFRMSKNSNIRAIRLLPVFMISCFFLCVHQPQELLRELLIPLL